MWLSRLLASCYLVLANVIAMTTQTGFESAHAHRTAAPRTADDHKAGREQLARLTGAVATPAAAKALEEAWDALVVSFGSAPHFPSFVTDDHTPFELSIVLSGREQRPEVRILAEPRDASGTLQGSMRAGLAMANRLESRFGAHLGRLRAIADLFCPDDPQPPFAIWFAVSSNDAGRLAFKAYLNPLVRGASLAPSLVEEALERLGLPSAWKYVVRAGRRGPPKDELRFFSIDLEESPSARVKVYTFHADATAQDIQEVAQLAQHHDTARLRSFLTTVAGGDGAFTRERSIGTCLSFTANARPSTCTVHFPIRSYAGNDEVAKSRIELAIAELELNPAGYRSAISAFPTRPLRDGSGLHSYASLRFDPDGPRLNLYLSPELRAVAPARAHLRPVSVIPHRLETPLEVVAHYEKEWRITSHPFLRALARKPVDLHALTRVMLNFREAITQDFARRLAHTVACVEEEAIRSILAKQLNDELGDGDPTRTHARLFERLVGGLTSHLKMTPDESMVAPGRELGNTLETLYTGRHPYEGLGAALIMEVYGKQVDAFLGAQFRRQAALPDVVMEWLTLHEALEVEHVDESFEIAKLIPPGIKAEAAATGARELGLAGIRFFDGLYEACFA